MYVVEDSGACLFGCARLSHCGSSCGPLHGLPLRASVYRGCPCRDPPVCLDAQVGIKAKRQRFCGCWSVVLSMSCGGLPNKVNVIAPFCPCTCFVFRVWQQFLIHGHGNVRILTPLLDESCCSSSSSSLQLLRLVVGPGCSFQ